MSHLTHPNTVKVFLYGELEDGSLYIVMEFLEGKNLNQAVKTEGPMSLERAVPILAQACGALEEAHRAGIIHRDLKPENIFLCEQGGMKDYAKVLDFGLAKVTEREMRPGSLILTQEGMVFGTPEFMSPEQAQGKPLTAASDIYSLAVILYEVLTGKLPFEARTAMDYIQLHVLQAPTPVQDKAREGVTFPPLLWPVMAKALAKKSDDRFQSAVHFADALRAALNGASSIPPPAVGAQSAGAIMTSMSPPAATPATPAPAAGPPPPKPKPIMARTTPLPQVTAQLNKDSEAPKAQGGTPLGMVIGVALGCLVLGVLLTVVAMKAMGK
jgi:serine/threonine-protein kinase